MIAFPADAPARPHAAARGVPASAPTPAEGPTVAMLLSVLSFEVFFERVLKLDVPRYLSTYRNDFSWYYAAGLRENGVRPILYVPSLRHSGIHETDGGVRVRFLKCAAWYRPLEPLRWVARRARATTYALDWANAASFAPALDAGLAEDGVDLLYVQEYWTARFDRVVRRSRVPVCAADHGGRAGDSLVALKRDRLPRAAALYCQTRDEQAAVNGFGADATFLPNGCDTRFFTPPANGDDAGRTKSILTVARLNDRHKRTSDLIRALAALPADWVLDVVGTGPDQGMLADLARSTGVADRVRFHGFKSRDEVRDFARRCGVYAMPSANEAMCLAVLEAMACGAAVVLSDIRAFRAIVDPGVNGFLVPVADPARLAAGIEAAWRDREAVGRRAARTVAEQYDSAALYRRLADSMREAVAHGRPGRAGA